MVGRLKWMLIQCSGESTIVVIDCLRIRLCNWNVFYSKHDSVPGIGHSLLPDVQCPSVTSLNSMLLLENHAHSGRTVASGVRISAY